MSLRDVGPLSRDALNLRDTVSPPVARAPSQPPSYSQPRPPPRSVSSVSSGNQHSVQVHDQFSSLDRSRGSLTPTAPPLTASAANSLKDPLTGISLSIPSNNLISYMDDQEDDHRWTRSPGAISQSTTLTALSSSRKDPIPAPRGPVAAVYARGYGILNKADTKNYDLKMFEFRSKKLKSSSFSNKKFRKKIVCLIFAQQYKNSIFFSKKKRKKKLYFQPIFD